MAATAGYQICVKVSTVTTTVVGAVFPPLIASRPIYRRVCFSNVDELTLQALFGGTSKPEIPPKVDNMKPYGFMYEAGG